MLSLPKWRLVDLCHLCIFLGTQTTTPILISCLSIGSPMLQRSQKLGGHQRILTLIMTVQKRLCCKKSGVDTLASQQFMTMCIDLRYTVTRPCMNGCKWPKGSDNHPRLTRLMLLNLQRMSSIQLSQAIHRGKRS